LHLTLTRGQEDVPVNFIFSSACSSNNMCKRNPVSGTTSIICSLLHDVVEDTEITLEEIEAIYGARVAKNN